MHLSISKKLNVFMKNLNFFLTLLLGFIITSCAKRGTITGGPKDTIAPVLVKSVPKNYETNFNGNEIRIDFSEYIKIKDVNKQLIISPPMDKKPTVSPQGSASKFISIKLNEELKPNTTYSFNFGQSIVDYNEGNPYNQFKYVFSTGSFVDSLKVSGKFMDAFENKADDYVNIQLYDATTFKDSTIYKEVPRYVTNTLDKNTSFTIENIKAGEYYLIALKDKNNDYKFQPKTEKIAFKKEKIKIPTDSTYLLKLFKEKTKAKFFKPTQESNNKLFLGFEGEKRQIKVVGKKDNKEIPLFVTNYSKEEKKDTLQIFLPENIKDSLQLKVIAENYEKEFSVKLKKMKISDSLSIKLNENQNLTFRDLVKLKTSTPVAKINKDKIQLKKRDSISIPFETLSDIYNESIIFDFTKEENESYNIKLLSGAIEDIYGNKNDSLAFTYKTAKISDFGNLKLRLKNVKRFPLVVEILANENTIVDHFYSEKETEINFEGIKPSLYTIRIYYDDNKNRSWDTGNYLQKKQPEELIYFSEKIDVRANWDVDQVLELNK